MHNCQQALCGIKAAFRREQVVSLAFTLAIGLVQYRIRLSGAEGGCAVRQALKP